jgi:membrane protease YdiL (CAAX protease family)
MILTLAGFFVLWLLLDRSAALLGSMRGEAGLIVCALVLVAAVAVESLFFGKRLRSAMEALGLRRASWRSLVVAVGLAVVLLAFFPIYSLATGARPGLRPDWAWLALGMLAQGGIAEEAVFRGFLFRHFREGRSFARAAWLSMIPFTVVHLLLFLTLDFALALASVALSVVIAFPLAWLFERAGNSVWPPALLHFVIQGAIKLVVAPEASFGTMAVAWMAVAGVVPFAVFGLMGTVPSPTANGRRG